MSPDNSGCSLRCRRKRPLNVAPGIKNPQAQIQRLRIYHFPWSIHRMPGLLTFGSSASRAFPSHLAMEQWHSAGVVPDYSGGSVPESHRFPSNRPDGPTSGYSFDGRMIKIPDKPCQAKSRSFRRGFVLNDSAKTVHGQDNDHENDDVFIPILIDTPGVCEHNAALSLV